MIKYLIIVSSFLFISCGFKKKEQALIDQKASEFEDTHYTKNNLYHQDFRWKNQHNKNISLATFEGSFTVLGFMSSTSIVGDSWVLKQMKYLDRMVKKDSINHVKFILISRDPAIDSPTYLENYALLHQLNSPDFSILKGDFESVRDVVNFISQKDTTLERKLLKIPTLTLLNKRGLVIDQKILESKKDTTQFIQKINSLE